MTATITDTGGLGPIEIEPPPGRLSVTPASLMAVRAVGRHAHLLRGHGLDWGTGSGLLAIAAAKVPAVELVVAMEVVEGDIAVARANASRNGVVDKVIVLHADSYEPFPGEEREALDRLQGVAEFLIANPPASRTGDGLDWRREALRGALDFLVDGAPVLLQISYQYSLARIEGLVDDVPGYAYEGLAGSSEWVRFDQGRDDLRAQLVEYAAVEESGGTPYTFFDGAGGRCTAVEALEHYRATGESPISKWQMHRYVRVV